MNIQPIIKQLKKDLSQVQTNRANPSMVEDVPVEYYGSQVTLKEVGTITAPEPRVILIQPWDKESLPNIEKALQAQSFNTQNNGEVVRVVMSTLSDEKKQKLIKEINEKAEQARIKVRQLRDQDRNEIKQITDEDEKYRQLEELDKETDKVNEQIEKIKQKKLKQVTA